MNIKITYNWLLEYLDTDAGPYELQKYLSLCGPSVETVQKIGDSAKGGLTDYVLDIEITSNRVDMASVFGIALEASAILPQFGKKAKLKMNPLKEFTFKSAYFESIDDKKLNLKIQNPKLVSRFTAVVLSNIDIKHAPDIIRKRLQMIDIKSINNVIDISNYLMVSLGQPTHMFDYDEIKEGTMILRESKKGEKIVTLDDKEITLPGGDIIIEDGSGRIIDLCGIMGGKNSSITDKTKNIVFFVQTYDKKKIRKTSMTTGTRTVAATYFEKGLDPSRVENTLVYGIELLKKYCGGKIDSKLYDIYTSKNIPKNIRVYLKDIQRIMGVPIKEVTITTILKALGFDSKRHEDEELAYPDGVSFQVTVPTYRADDIAIKEDIIEEIARVYGYFNLPNNISPMVYIEQPKEIEKLFEVSRKIKTFLKNIGLHEVMNYSMISKELIEKLDLNLNSKLKLENTISEEIAYLRTALAPSLIKNIKDNEGKREKLNFFEIAKVYEKKKNDLPNEIYRLGIAVNTSFEDLKGIIEALLSELNIKSFETKKRYSQHYTANTGAEILIANRSAVRFGQLKKNYQNNIELKNNVFLAEFELDVLNDNYKLVSPYILPPQYSVIKLDANIKLSKHNFADMKKIAQSVSKLLYSIEFLSSYKDTYTIRFNFTSPKKNIIEDEAKKELSNILSKL